MNDESGLIDKLRKIEALFANAGTDGERAAAGSARDRIRERLERLERVETPTEYRFSLGDPWSNALFTALARRYGLKPYRYRGQRKTTVMLKATRTFVDETLWPEFCQADATLRQYLQDVTQRVIAQAVSGDFADLEERPESEASKSGSHRTDQHSMDFS